MDRKTLYLVILKFISRNPKKSMGYIRDIAIVIIILLSVSAIFFTVNNQISLLFGLAPSNNNLLIRNVEGTIDESFIPVGLENDLKSLDLDTVLPVVHIKTNVSYYNEDREIRSQIYTIFTNVSLL
ncbi:MAG: hypothetical protein ACC656_06865, partial [Candidatus Heimdallarchaeota archaeon]